MTKAAFISLGIILLLASSDKMPAQTSPTDIAVTEAVKRQADTIVLRNKLAEAKTVEGRGDVAQAAKIYQDAVTLTEQIGSGIDVEKAQAISGLVATRLTLARQAQSQGDLHGASTQVSQVLKVDPQNAAALAFKKQNEQMIAAMAGRIPDDQTLEQIPIIAKDRTQAGTLVQDGKLLYEMGNLDDAEAKFSTALKLDPDNIGASYYMNLIQQARYGRESMQHTVNTQQRITAVEKQWVQPTSHVLNGSPNPYATNNLVYTGPGRQAIVDKLDRIQLANVSYGDSSAGLPLSEVLRDLAEKVRVNDPDKKGINFLINPNTDNSGPVIASTTAGFPGGGQTPVDQATGLPAAPAATGGGEAGDIGSSISIKLNLTDVRLADVLDAIVLVADHPIKYSIEDFAVVFSAKESTSPQLYTRRFRVDPNTFYSGLESVSAQSFGSVSSSGSSGGGGSSSGGGGGGGGSSGQNNGAVVGIVNVFSGAGGLRSSGGGGGGGGGGSSGSGTASPIAGANGGAGGGTGGGGGGAGSQNGGIQYVTTPQVAQNVSIAARSFFTTLGVNLLQPPGKAVFFNDRLGLLIVRATQDDLDIIEQAIQGLNEVAPQVHIKSRFIEVEQDDTKQIGFDWYLGQVSLGNVVGDAGTAPSLNVPVSQANPLGAFPGSTAASIIPGASTDQQLFNSGLGSASSVATITGIMTDPNFRVVLHALEQRTGFENLAEPEVTTTSGRQTQMRATQIINVVTGFTFQEGSGAVSTPTTGGATP